MEGLFFDIGILVIVAAILGYLSNVLRQPLLLAYILGGILLGPTGLAFLQKLILWGGQSLPPLHLIGNTEVIDSISVLGHVLLLFLIGLELNLKKVREFSATIILVAALQIVATFLLAAGLGSLLGFGLVGNLYLAIGLVLSSNIVAVKYLSDNRDLNSLYGRLVVGILLAQDLVAIFALILIATLGTTGTISWFALAHAAIKLGWLIVLTIILGRYIFPLVFRVIARSLELLFLSGIALAFLFALMAENLHISLEIGAFLAGLSLASLPYHVQLISRIKPLRDFFIMLFFVLLGMHLDLSVLSEVWPQTLLLILFVLLLKPLVVVISMGLLGFKRRNAFLAGISLAHVSEFSLFILYLGRDVGQVDKTLLAMLTVTMMISIVISSYCLTHRYVVYRWLASFLRLFERRQIFHPLEVAGNVNKKLTGHIVLCGYNEVGRDVLINIASATKNYVVVDLDPGVIRELMCKRVPCLYGDITDEEILHEVNAREARAVVSTLSDPFSNLTLVEYVRAHNKKTVLVVLAESVADALALYEAGADYVVLLEAVGGEHAAMVFEDIQRNNLERIFRLRHKQIGQLKLRQLLG